MKKLAAITLFSSLALAAGCAATGTGLPDRDGKSPSGGTIDLDPSSPDDAERTFPERISAVDLPAADRLSHRIVVERGGAVAATLRLCVAPSGAVDGVELVSSSGMTEYDQLVVAAAGEWRYAAYAAPDDTRVCDDVTVAYRAP